MTCRLSNTKIKEQDIYEEISKAMANGQAAELLLSWKDKSLLEKLFPELYQCIGVDGGQGHAETVFDHLIECLKNASEYPVPLQWAVLLHDIGKPQTIKIDTTTNPPTTSFHKHEVVGAAIAFKLCCRFQVPLNIRNYIFLMVRHHMFYFESDTSDKAIKRWLLKVGKNQWKDLFLLRQADRKGNFAKKGKSPITKAMSQLEARIKTILEKNLVVFSEDINISKKEIFKFAQNDEHLFEITSNLIGLLNNSSPERNNPIWIKKYLENTYGPKKDE